MVFSPLVSRLMVFSPGNLLSDFAALVLSFDIGTNPSEFRNPIGFGPTSLNPADWL
jgi:hypothetical protein